VPPKVRLFFMRELYQIQKFKYLVEQKAYKERCLQIQKETVRRASVLLVEQMLSGQKIVPEWAQLPPKPFIRYIVDKEFMIALVKEVLDIRFEWEKIEKGKFYDSHTLRQMLEALKLEHKATMTRKEKTKQLKEKEEEKLVRRLEEKMSKWSKFSKLTH